MDCLKRDHRLTRTVTVSNKSRLSLKDGKRGLQLSSGRDGVFMVEEDTHHRIPYTTPLHLSLTKAEARELGEQLIAHANAV